MRRMLWVVLLLVGCCLGLAAGPAAATLLLEENFDYPVGTLLTATGNWTAHSGGGTQPIDVTGPGLAYPGYASSGIGNAALVDNNGEDDNRTFPVQSSGAVYYGFMVSSNSPTAGYFFHLIQTGTTFAARVFAQPSGGGMQLGISNTSSSPAYAASEYALGTTHLVVVKFDFASQLASLWVNPALGGAEPPADAVSPTAASGFSAGAVALRQYATTQHFIVDGIRVGTEWADVAGGGAPSTGACCFADGACSLLEAAACAAQGGAYQGDGTSCNPNPCPQPGSGACCAPTGLCAVLSAAECAAQGGSYQGENTLCSPNPCPFPFRTLCEVAADNPDGRPQLEGQYVEVEGVAHVNSGTWSATTQQFEISDGECCVSVFGGPIDPAVAVGDRVRVRGTVTYFSGLTEISSPDLSISILSSGHPVYGPGLVTTGQLGSSGEAYEACLIRVECATIVSGTWPAAGQNANLVIDDGTGPATLRIDRDTDIDGSPAPTGPINITGVCIHFTGGSPPYQILPRSLEDITPCALPGACCFADGSCQALLQADCLAQGGTFFGGPCDPNPCPQPGAGACCFPNGTCQVRTGAECAAQGGVYQGDNIPCTPNPCPPPLVPICEVAADNPDGTPVLLNQLVEVEGIAHVTSGTWNTTTQQFELSDGECCVSVFGGSINPVVNVGDRVRVRGTVIQYQGLTELSNPGLQVTVLSSGNPVFGPGDVTTGQLGYNGEPYEACLIRVTCATIVSGTWPPAGQNSNLIINDGTGPATLRIDKETDIDGTPAPTGPIDIVGVCYQFAGNDPPYQILPRSLADITPCSIPQPGACCFASGACAVLLADECAAQGGAYQGPLTDCDPNPCPQPDGACCFPNGVCVVLLPEDCYTADGSFLGGPCDPNPCPQPLGACCLQDGTCQYLNQTDCAVLAGQWLGMGTVCNPNPCPQPPGACCYPDGSCAVTPEAECPTGIWFLFAGCDPNPCPQPFGACCYPDGSCVVTLQAQCSTGTWLFGQGCDPNPCPQPPPLGACCFLDGTCQVATEASCLAAQGQWQGPGTGCDPNPCPPPVPVERTTWGRIKGMYR